MSTSQQKLDALVADLAKDLQPLVVKIEAEKLQTTRNHYGRYMNMLIALLHSDPAAAAVIRLALLAAGANPQGVADGFRAAFGR